jgi:hypothetical protein
VDQAQACLAQVDRDTSVLALRDLTIELGRGLDLPVVSTPRTLDQARGRAAHEFGLPV